MILYLSLDARRVNCIRAAQYREGTLHDFVLNKKRLLKYCDWFPHFQNMTSKEIILFVEGRRINPKSVLELIRNDAQWYF